MVFFASQFKIDFFFKNNEVLKIVLVVLFLRDRFGRREQSQTKFRVDKNATHTTLFKLLPFNQFKFSTIEQFTFNLLPGHGDFE